MRRIMRRDLSPRIQQYLDRKQAEADRQHAQGTLNIDAVWESARKTRTLQEGVLGTLRAMAGSRARCMYCSDSHGSDIEHFWPKTPYPGRMFRWLNMLLCCTECGRFKGDRFPLIDEQPALIDPTIDNPWEFLDFDPDTSLLVARYDHEHQQEMPKGERTVRVLNLDRREALSNGYRQTFRRLQRRIVEALAQPEPDADVLFHDLSADDDHGLLGWCFDGLGSRVAPFSDLQIRHPQVWETCRERYQNR